MGSQYQTGVYWMDRRTRHHPLHRCPGAAAVPFFAVELKALACFYPAEEFHQRYLEKHPRGYCHVAPWKLAALPDFPFSTKTYTRPAKELLQTWKEAGEVSF